MGLLRLYPPVDDPTVSEVRSAIVELLEKYRAIEQQFDLSQEIETYADLVTASDIQDYPIQRWFHLKEAFSIKLLGNLLRQWDIPLETVERVLDPFCGIGTTLLSCQSLAREHGKTDIEAVGIERNPFLHFVAQTKARWHKYDASVIETQKSHLLNGADKPQAGPIPDLSTLHRADAFDPGALKEALGYREAIRKHLDGIAEKDVLLLGYASILEAISGLRKDGRALRFVEGKKRAEVSAALKSAWQTIADDLSVAEGYFMPIDARILLGDGRKLVTEQSTGANLGQFDIVFYSPPYLNNIDYTEVYKVELWMCGFIETRQQFREQRYRTFRSHPSVRFPDPITIRNDPRTTEVLSAVDALVKALPSDENLGWRTELFWGYFDDMYQSLKHQMNVLKPGGWIFCVVGNSLHGPKDNPESRVPVAADLIIALTAQALGLEMKAIQVARHLTRRKPNYGMLRESILVMQRPERREP